MQRSFARQNLPLFIFVKATLFARPQCITCRRRLPKYGGVILRFAPSLEARFTASGAPKGWFTFRTSLSNRVTSNGSQGSSRPWSLGAFEPWSEYQWLRTEILVA